MERHLMCASFNSTPVSFDTPCFKNLDSEDLLLSFEKIRTDVTECRNLWNNKFKNPGKMVLLPHDIVKRLDSVENMISSVISECKKDYVQFVNKPLTSDFPCAFYLGVSEDLGQSLEKISRAVSDGKECAKFSSKPVSSDTPCFKNLDVEDLLQSFEKICTDVTECRNLWNNKFRSPGKVTLLSHDIQKRLDSIENMTSSIIAECKKDYRQFINKPFALNFPCVFNLGASEDLRQSPKKTSRAVANGKKCAKFSSKPLSSDFPCSRNLEVQVHIPKKENLEVLEDIRQSLEKVCTAAAECRNLWKSSGEVVPLYGFGNLLDSVENINTAKAKFEGAILFIGKHFAVDFPSIFNSGVSGDLVERTESAKFISKPFSFDLPCFKNVEVSENLRQSLEKISSAVVECKNLWNNKITSSGNLVPLPEFQKLLESHGLLWHKCVVLKNGWEVTANQLQSRINQGPYYLSDLLPDLTSESLWEKASKDFFRVCEICFQLERSFNGQQVGQLASFLEYLIMIQEEQRSVAYRFVEHLLQLKKSIVRLNDLFTKKSNVGSDGDEDECPLVRNKNLTVKCMWKQMHMFDSLYIMSRESSSLLKEAEDKSDNCSTTVDDELHKILGIIKGKKFMNARQSMDSFCGRTWNLDEFPAAECSRVFLAPKSMKQLLRSSFKILDQLRCVLQGKIVGKSSVTEKLIGKSSVTEKLIGCFYDVLSKGKLIEKEYFDGLRRRKQLLKDTGSLVDIEVVSEIEFAKSVTETSKQIDEAVQKLVTLRGSILSEDSPHRKITLWRVVYESLLVNLQLDLICENLGGTIKLGVKLLDNARPNDSTDVNKLHASILKLIGCCNGVLLDFLAMHKTVAEATCMVAEVLDTRCSFTTFTGVTGTLEEQGLDFSFEEDADICDDVKDDDYDWEDPDVMYIMSGGVAGNFDDGLEFD